MSTVLKDIDCKIICCFSFLVIILQKLVYLNYLQNHTHCLKKDERSISLKSAWMSSAGVVLHLSSSPWEGFSSVIKETYIHLDVLCCYSAVKRLMKEAAELREPTEHYHAQPLEVGPLLQYLTAPFTVIYTHTHTHTSCVKLYACILILYVSCRTTSLNGTSLSVAPQTRNLTVGSTTAGSCSPRSTP